MGFNSNVVNERYDRGRTSRDVRHQFRVECVPDLGLAVYCLLKPLRWLVTVNEPSARADTSIQ